MVQDMLSPRPEVDSGSQESFPTAENSKEVEFPSEESRKEGEADFERWNKESELDGDSVMKKRSSASRWFQETVEEYHEKRQWKKRSNEEKAKLSR